MTSQEFQDNICSLDDLYSFCSEHDIYEFFDDRYLRDEDGLEDYISEFYLETLINNYSWDEIRGWLNDLKNTVDNYYWFCTEETHPEGVPMSGDLYDELKDEVFEWALENDIFEDTDMEGRPTRPVPEAYRRVGHDPNETQVKWNCEVRKVEETFEEPQGDISLVMCF